jgi:chemotaxis protein MotB
MSDEKPLIIIKKIKKVGGHGHHGGAWKVAYADFVTAMMAFFLLMWLLNATTEEQKRGLSNYFGPAGELSGSGGSGGVLAGLTITSEGLLDNSVMSGEGRTDGQNYGKKGLTDTEVTDDQDNADHKKQPVDRTVEGPTMALFQQNPPAQNQRNQETAVIRLEKENFKEVEAALKQAILEDPELKKLAENLIIDMTPEGLRIQLVDQQQYAMFPLGDAEPYPQTRRLLDLVARVVQKLPNKISITGHTDALLFNSKKSYSNWELSADRANASRRYLLQSNLNPNRIIYVAGKAATEPLLPANPTAAQNRRISIVLHYLQGSHAKAGEPDSVVKKVAQTKVIPKPQS